MNPAADCQLKVTPLFDKSPVLRYGGKGEAPYSWRGHFSNCIVKTACPRPLRGSLLNTYRVICTINPSPYMFYFSEPT